MALDVNIWSEEINLSANSLVDDLTRVQALLETPCSVSTVFPRSSDRFYIVTYCMKLVTTSWTTVLNNILCLYFFEEIMLTVKSLLQFAFYHHHLVWDTFFFVTMIFSVSTLVIDVNKCFEEIIFSVNSLLAELQFAFLCFLVGQNFDSFEHWKQLGNTRTKLFIETANSLKSEHF